MNNVIAIDGPSASGKSTVARRVAASLDGYLYVDSGALYRLVTYYAVLSGIPPEDNEKLRKFLSLMAVDFARRDKSIIYSYKGKEAGQELRSSLVNDNVSYYSALPCVREKVVLWLRSFIEFGSLVVEGRDIGTVVFPDAIYKFYLDASLEERTKRRYQEMIDRNGIDISPREIGHSLEKRDKIDSTRKVAPLKIAEDAIVIDTTGMTIEEVVALILAKIKEKNCEKNK